MKQHIIHCSAKQISVALKELDTLSLISLFLIFFLLGFDSDKLSQFRGVKFKNNYSPSSVSQIFFSFKTLNHELKFEMMISLCIEVYLGRSAAVQHSARLCICIQARSYMFA